MYYDFGMMGTIPSDIREGLLDLFYGVYQKDPDLYAFHPHLSSELSFMCIGAVSDKEQTSN